MKKQHTNAGFTIVELMIALSIFSVILVIATTLIIRINTTFTKGVNAANLQNANRAVVADLTSALQFSAEKPQVNLAQCDPVRCYTEHPGGDTYTLCLGTTRYTFLLNTEQGIDNGIPSPSPHPHVLWRDTKPSVTPTCAPADLTQDNPSAALGSGTVPNSGADLVSNHLRITRFVVKPAATGDVTGTYLIDTYMAYGDSDLMNVFSSDGHVRCKGQAGSEFCGLSHISTSVVKRLR